MNLNGTRILVTGGAGFVGSHVVEALVRAGATVRIYDNFSSGHEENIAAVRSDVEIIRGDILDAAALTNAAQGMDIINHQAAQLEIIRCIEMPVEDLRSNAEGTLNVLDAAKKASVAKVVFASSACVYGQALYTPEDEQHPTVPNWPYGVSKLAAEHYARLYSDYYGIDTIGLRYSIVYGPREWYGRVLTAFLKRALDRQPPVVWGGLQERDFVFVEDVARLNAQCVAANLKGASIFNGSTGIATNIRSLAQLVCEQFDLGDPIFEEVREGEVSQLVTGRMRLPAELKQMVLDSSRARKVLGWEPAVSINDGLLQEMEWLREHQSRWTVMHY